MSTGTTKNEKIILHASKEHTEISEELPKNNNKPWFESHRKAYEAAREDFEVFVQGLIDKIGKKTKPFAV
jgi:hypothetical protein